MSYVEEAKKKKIKAIKYLEMQGIFIKMTRYARAKGSKASNERLPNEATPWYLMKQQLEESKKKEPLETKKSVKELLKDDRNENISHDWAEFDDRSKLTRKHKKSKENCIQPTENPKNNSIVCTTTSKNNNNVEKLEEIEHIKIKKTDNEEIFFNRKKHNDSHLYNEKKSSTLRDAANSSFIALSKRQKRNQKRKLEMSDKQAKRLRKDVSDASFHSKLKEKKIKQKGEYKRRKPDVGITKIIINGVETEITKYDGFPVRKEDAERLTELKNKLIMKGIPISEVNIVMKLERRKAEKALTRVKKLVCFNCRKSGHLLSDCPELDKEDAGMGICFKCGSTEHTHFECKINKHPTYRYAKCFICHEQGHIAMQCPDNPKGIYPHGGCCKICSAVTHMKKDCPDLVNVKEGNVITVEKMDDYTTECLQKDVKRQNRDNGGLKNKIVKF